MRQGPESRPLRRWWGRVPCGRLGVQAVLVAIGLALWLVGGYRADGTAMLLAISSRAGSTPLSSVAAAMLWQIVWACLVSVVGGGVIAALIWRFPEVARAVRPAVLAWMAAPLALSFLLSGKGGGAALGSMVWGTTLVAATASTMMAWLYGFRRAARRYGSWMRAVGASPWQIFRLAVLPGALPTLPVALRLGLAMGSLGVVARFVTDSGDSHAAVTMDAAWAAACLVSVIAAALYGLLSLWHRGLWSDEEFAGDHEEIC